MILFPGIPADGVLEEGKLNPLSYFAVEYSFLAGIKIIGKDPFRRIFSKPDQRKSTCTINSDRSLLTDERVTNMRVLGVHTNVRNKTSNQTSHQHVVKRLTMTQFLFYLIKRIS